VYARLGDRVNAQAILKAATDAKEADAPLIAAHLQLGAGNATAALTLLDSAARARAPLLTAESLAEPIFDPVRSSPRFRDILHTLGLPETLTRPSP
jgi:hypothetical protein